MNLPPAIIFINSDELRITPDGYFLDGYSVSPDGYINDRTRETLEMQLFLEESMTLKEFNTRVANDPNYPAIVHLQGYRIMVIVPDYHDHTNRAYADVVLFYSHGLVKVEKNKFGPPGYTRPLERINIYELLRDVGSKYVVILPPSATKPPHSSGCSCVHCPNPDNEYNNPDFINRK